MQINTLMTSSEVKRSRNLPKSENSNSLGKITLNVWELMFLHSEGTKEIETILSKIFLEFMAFCCHFFCIKMSKNGAVSKTDSYGSKSSIMPHCRSKFVRCHTLNLADLYASSPWHVDRRKRCQYNIVHSVWKTSTYNFGNNSGLLGSQFSGFQ